MVVVLIGPMGCGKSTIGTALAARLNQPFYDGDDFHPPENKEKMGKGIALDDKDREPWLKTLAELIHSHNAESKPMILACSALKQRYRDLLGIDQEQVVSILLYGEPELLQERIAHRQHEYMSKELLQSQLDTLEIPETGITVDIDASVETICDRIENALNIRGNK